MIGVVYFSLIFGENGLDNGVHYSRFECHLAPDWLLIYKIENQTVIFERTGTHSDLF